MQDWMLQSEVSKKVLRLRTAWKLSKCGVFSGPYFPVFSPNTGKYGPEKSPYLDTFHEVTSTFSPVNDRKI